MSVCSLLQVLARAGAVTAALASTQPRATFEPVTLDSRGWRKAPRPGGGT